MRGLLLIAFAAGCSASAPPTAVDEEALHGPHQLAVLTQNLYIGVDLVPLLGVQTLCQLENGANALFQQIGPGGTDLPARAGAIAHEIALRAPDLVGLEEAALWTRGSGATLVAYDFLGLLVDALCNVEHVCYSPVVVQLNADIIVPADADCGPGLEPVHLADHDAILVRDGSPVRVQRTYEGHFATVLSIPTLFGLTFTVPRGWVAIDARFGDVRFRFVDTHLEAFADPIRDAQAIELLLGPTLTKRPVIAAGDFNFDPTTPPYRLTRGFGFADAWRRVHPHDPGFTCCQDADLRNPSSHLDERIDYVFARGGFAPTAAALVGAAQADRVGGLWPSDHAGVAATLHPLYDDSFGQ